MTVPQYHIVVRYREVRRILEVSIWSLPDAERLDVLLPSGLLSTPVNLVLGPLLKGQSQRSQDIALGFTAHWLLPEPPPPIIVVRLALKGGGTVVTDVAVAWLPEFDRVVTFRGHLNTISGEPNRAVATTASIVGSGNALSFGKAVRLTRLVLDVEGDGNLVRIGDGVEASGHVVIRANHCRLLIEASESARALSVWMHADRETRVITALQSA